MRELVEIGASASLGPSAQAQAPRKPLKLKPPQPTPVQWIELGLEYWRSALAYILVVATPILAYVGNLGFAPLVALIGMGALVFLGRKETPSIGVGILLALLIWLLISMTWSPAMPAHPNFHKYKTVEALTGMKLVFELAFYSAAVVALRRVSDETAARASLILGFGFAAMAVLLVIEALDGAAVYQAIKAAIHQKARPDLATRNVARACYVATVLFWPIALRLRAGGQSLALALFAGGLFVSAAIFKVDAPILALILATFVFLGVRAVGRAIIWMLIAGTVIYFAAAPLVAHAVTGLLHAHAAAGPAFVSANPVLNANLSQAPAATGPIAKQSWFVRLEIWRFVSSEILANPIKGWGMDASRAWPSDIPLHPHDAALQLWLELGAFGAAMAALFWGWLFSRVAMLTEEDRDMGAAAAAAAVSYLTIGALSFGVWQEWWLAVGAVALIVCSFVAASRRTDPYLGHDFSHLRPID
jgi:O-antigen ligase